MLFDLDLMDPNRLRPMGLQDLLGQRLLLGRSDADPKDETARGHEVIEASGLVSPKNPGNQQEAGASDNDTHERGGDSAPAHRRTSLVVGLFRLNGRPSFRAPLSTPPLTRPVKVWPSRVSENWFAV